MRARWSPEDNPGERIGGLVNNRGDRVPRSRVFARILAGDAAAYVYVVIGTNLGGFRGCLREGLTEVVANLCLGPEAARAGPLWLGRRIHLRRWDMQALTDEVWRVGDEHTAHRWGL